MKALVTGASVPLGGTLASLLSDSGFTVRVLLRPDEEPATPPSATLERVPGSVLDQESVMEAVGGCHAVFHCDTTHALRPARSRQIAVHNLEGTRNVLVAVTRAGVENLLHVGCASSCGFGDAERPGDEQTPYAGASFGLASFDSQHAAQELVLRYAGDGRVRGAVFNPTLLLEGGSGSPGASLLACLSRGLDWFPSGGVNVVGVREAAAAVLKALGRGEAGRVYILGGENVTYGTLFKKLAAALEVPAPTRAVTDRRLFRRGSAGSLALRLGGSPALTAPEARLLTTTMFYDPARAATELQLARPSLDGVVERACGAWRDHNVPARH